MDPITAFIGAVSFDIVKSACGNRADAIAVKNWQKLRENLRLYQPDANHDLQKAIHCAYLQATLLVCALRAKQLGINVSAWFSFASKAVAAINKAHTPPLAGVFSQADAMWLEAVSLDLFEQIKELNRDDYQLPVAGDNEELERLKREFELLLQPAGIEAREQEIRAPLMAKALQDIESKHGTASREFSALFNGQWYGLLCGCFQCQLKNDSKVESIFTGKLLAGIYARGNDGRDAAVSVEFVMNACAQLGGDLSRRFDATDALIKQQGQQLDRLEHDALVPLLALEQNTAARIQQIEALLADIRADAHQEGELTRQAMSSAVADVRADVHSESELIRQDISSLRDDLARGGAFARMGKAEPLLLLTPTGERLIVDREPECATILRELKSATGLRVLPIVAPGGFGKTALVTKTLREVTDEQRITDADVQAILRLDCQQGRLTLGRLFIEAGRLVGQSEAFQQVYASAELALQERLDYLFRELSRAGNVWIILDTFEDMLGADATVTDKGVEAFIDYGLSHEQGVRLILTTREMPKLAGRHRLAPLAEVNDALMQGLPEADAISYLRSEGAQCGLGEGEATDELLRDFCRRVHRIPMALRSVVGYLSDDVYPAKSLKDLMDDDEVFRDFDDRDAESGLKSLIARQLDRLRTEAQMLLALLAFFGKPVPQNALELLMPKLELARALNRLYTNKLVNRETDRFGINRYSLHPIILDRARLKLAEYESRINEAFAQGCWSLAAEAYHKARFRLALDMYDCCEMLYRHLITANARSELANDLATALMNKALLLEKMEAWDDALALYEEAIRLTESCVVNAKMEHLLPDLLQTIRYRLMTMFDLRRWAAAQPDMMRFLSHAASLMSADDLPDAVAREIAAMRDVLRSLSVEDRAQLLAAMGDAADIVRLLIED